MSDLENSACTGSCDTCGSDCNLDLSNPNATVTLTLDDDSELVCAVLTIFPAGEHKYIALLPLEYEIAADAFDELLDSAEYDEVVDGKEL